MNNKRIVQIMPADGWGWVELWTEAPNYRIWPLVGWALCEVKEDDHSRPSTEVAGLDAGDVVVMVEEISAFHLYVKLSDVTDADRAEWAAEGANWVARRNRQT